MIHFLGILELGTRQPIASAEAPYKKSFFSFARASEQSRDDTVLSPAEQDALILAGKLPEYLAEDRRFTYALATHTL